MSCSAQRAAPACRRSWSSIQKENGYLIDIGLAHPTALDFNGLFDNEIAHFIDCIQNGGACRAPAKDGVTIMRILDAVYESARTGHEVILQEG